MIGGASHLMSLQVVAAWPFVHPGIALATTAAALIPLIVHLINRRRYKRTPWAAMGFLLAANQRSLRRIRLEHWVLLAVRTGAIVLFGLAVARPFLSAASVIGLGESHWHRVLLIDNSLSASASEPDDQDRTHQPAAAAVADRLLAAFPRGDAISVITVAHPAEPVVGHAAFDRRTVGDRLTSIRATRRATDLPGGLSAALEVMQASSVPPENRAVYVISDQAASAWQADEQAVAAAGRIAEKATLVIVPTSDRDRENLAVTSLVCRDPLPGTHLPIRLEATVANFHSNTARDLALRVRRDGRIVRRIALDPIEPGGHQEVVFSIVVETAGPHAVDVRLEAPAGDALPVDDLRHLSLEVFDSVPVLLVDGQPGPTRLTGEAGYLATALAPAVQPGQRSLLDPKVVTELELPGEALNAYRLIALCNVQRFEESGPAGWDRLDDFVRRGGGLLVFLGDAVSRDNYNRFGYAEGEGLLPGKLGEPIGDQAKRDTFVRLQADSFVHPVLTDFADAHDSGLFLKGRIWRFAPVEVNPTTATVLLRYTDGHPAVVERSYGSGRGCLVTTSANMAWNNLAARGDYVSMTWALAAHLCARSQDGRNLIVGGYLVEPLTARQSAAAASPRITTPDGTIEDASLDTAPGPAGSSGGYELRYGPTETTGIYTASIGNDRVLFAANIDPGESDLDILDEQALRTLLKCPFVYLPDPGGRREHAVGGGSSEFARSLYYLVGMLLLCEVWLAVRFTTR